MATSPARFSAESPCPICGGYESLPRGHKQRCHGFLSSDGSYAHCSRDEHAGGLPFDGAGTYAHRMAGTCKCGREHSISDTRTDTPRRIVAVYPYRNATGDLAYEVVRYEPKDFKQRRPDGNGGWIWKLDGIERVLFRLPELLAADPSVPVFVTEGEKAALALTALGLLATCSSGGAGKWNDSYAAALAGRQIIVLPDNDEPGARHGAQVAASVRSVAASVAVLKLPGLPKAGDIVDWLGKGGDVETLWKLVHEAGELPAEPPKEERATFLPDVYRFSFPVDQVDIRLERLHEARGGDLTAEIMIESSRAPRPGMLHHARLNLISTTARQSLTRLLTERQTDTDWGEILEKVCHRSIEQWREGEPVVYLRDVEPQTAYRWLLTPYVERGGPTILFADGGAGKSTFALAIAISVAGGVDLLGSKPTAQVPVLYLDWESDEGTHADRLRAICYGAGIYENLPDVLYRRQSSSLAESAPYLRRVVAEKGIGMVIIDSLGAARGGEPESADSTIRLFNAARTLGVPWIGVDHVTKNGGDGQAKPFGSVFTHNLARITWSIEKAEQTSDSKLMVALVNHKANNGKLQRRHGFSVDFREDSDGRPLSVYYESCDMHDIPGAIARMSQPQQIADVLFRNHGAMAIADIERCLEEEGIVVKSATLRMQLYRHKDRFVPLRQPDGTTIWGLKSNARE